MYVRQRLFTFSGFSYAACLLWASFALPSAFVWVGMVAFEAFLLRRHLYGVHLISCNLGYEEIEQASIWRIKPLDIYFSFYPTCR